MKLTSKLNLFLFLFLFGIGQNVFALEPDIVVAKDGSGDFTTLQAAIDAVPSNQTDRRTVIFIKNGLYDTEKLIVPTNKLNVSLIGESRDQTIISYDIYNCSDGEDGLCPDDKVALWTGFNIRTSATLTIQGEGFRAENLTIQNTAGPVGQALAITVTADKTAFINCDLLGYQDTIYLWTTGKRSYFEGCLVLGRTDYIYGGGIGYFNACEIRSYGGGWITAPSTPQNQDYGFVFYHCDITYATGSPRNGDDGALVRFGRPWHEYPKVAWLYCDMTEKIHPEGWGDTWNMEYSPTSPDLHLYEYMNTGPGADMSGRANWVGLRALTDEEAPDYTPAAVLNGNDGWAPYEEEPLVTTYEWDGGGTDNGWLTPENWNPDGTPASAEVANISGAIIADADGGTFEADLNLKEGATLNLTASSVATYIAGEKATIAAAIDVSLSGKIATKDTLVLSAGANFTIASKLTGIHEIIKSATGTVILTGDNTDFSGMFTINEGAIDASVENSLGKAGVEVKNGATLKVGDDGAFFPESLLKVYTGSTLELNADVTLSEFYIDDVLQDVDVYDATTNPGLISGEGSIVVGRPSSFTFAGGPWDNVSGYTPALLPEAGETVYCEGEMETASTVNVADVIFVEGKGKLRLRGVHTSTGTLTFEGNQRISYATGGTGFSLEAPIVINDDINFEMSSNNVAGSTMTLTGTITGNATVTVKNTRSDVGNDSKVWLGGDNSGFGGMWDVTTTPSHVDGTAGLVGASANAFGTANIIVGNKNYVQFDHAESVSSGNALTLETGSKAVVNEDITVGQLTLEGTSYNTGVFSLSTNPGLIEGSGSITVGGTATNKTRISDFSAVYDNGRVVLNKNVDELKIYSINGVLLNTLSISNRTVDVNLKSGVYLLIFDNKNVSKLIVNN